MNLLRTMIWSLCLMLFLGTAALHADESTLQFDQANQLYREGKFKDAASIYEQIRRNGYESPELYFNLGNAHFKLNDIPAAIIAYERARRLAPGDEDIDYNLRIANLRVVDKIEPLPSLFLFEWWKNFVNLFSADRWAIITVTLFWVMVVLGATAVTTRSFLLSRIGGIGAVLVLALGILTMVCSIQRHRIETDTSMAVVTTPSVSVKSAPDTGSTDLFVIHEGLKLEVMDSFGDWKKVRLADGKIGWLTRESVEQI